jgi:hypothetical protein
MTEPQPPYVEKNFITKEECDQIIKLASKTYLRFTAMEAGRSEVALDDVPKEVVQILQPILLKVQNLIISKLGGNPEEHHLDHSVLSRMTPGSYVSYHSDNSRQSGYSWIPNHTAWRTYSACLYLSECHGGALRFPYRKVEVKIEPGTLVGFPSDEAYFHGAEPVTAGIRWGIIIWFTKAEIYNMWDRLRSAGLIDAEVKNAGSP